MKIRRKTKTDPAKCKISIEGDSISAVSPEGQTVAMKINEFVSLLTPRQLDTAGVVVPDGTKLVYSHRKTTVLVHETPPQVRSLMWIANDSDKRWGGAKYRKVRIALPYLVVLASYENGVISDWNECFFRTAPLETEEDQLYFPALLNCSKFPAQAGRPLSWICSQNLDRRAVMQETNVQKRYRAGLRVLMHCLLETGFNFSSEDHEGDSWFSESTKIDPRIATIEQWEKTTAEEGPLFVLDVPWIKTDMSVKQIVDRMFQIRGGNARGISSAADLARLLFNRPKLTKKSAK